jgi:hypothetical protein
MTAAGVGSSSVPERDITKDKLVQFLDEGAESAGTGLLRATRHEPKQQRLIHIVEHKCRALDGGRAAKPADCPFGAASMIMRTTHHNVQIEDLFVVVVVKWLAGFSSPAARMAVWPA